MSHWFERYQQGFHQEVYNELVAMKEQVLEQPIYQEALLVARTMMSRIRHNIDVLIPRLKTLGYELIDGDWSSYWEQAEYPDPELNELLRAYREPPLQTLAFLQEIEQRVGALPLAVRCWYEEVGSVNLIGTFPRTAARKELSDELDPLLILPVDCLLEQYPFATPEEWEEARNEDGTFDLDLAVDADLKYNISGSGGYFIQTPCHAFDTTFDLLGYHHVPSPTFINYLRTCFRWGGFFGLSAKNRPTLTLDELAFLTEDLLAF
jgi:hypothetical protein